MVICAVLKPFLLIIKGILRVYSLSFFPLACDCDPLGCIDTLCDAVTGQCHCKCNVVGLKCDTCAPGYTNLTDTHPDDVGCEGKKIFQNVKFTNYMLHLHALNSFLLECKCDLEGSKSFICDWKTGQCDCKSEFIVGDKCDQSMDGYWNFPNSKGT